MDRISDWWTFYWCWLSCVESRLLQGLPFIPVMDAVMSRHQSWDVYSVNVWVVVADHWWVLNGSYHLHTHFALVWLNNCFYEASIETEKHVDRWLLCCGQHFLVIWSSHTQLLESSLQIQKEYEMTSVLLTGLLLCESHQLHKFWKLWCFAGEHRTIHIQEKGVWGLAMQREWTPLRDPQHQRSNTQCQRSQDPTGHTQSEFQRHDICVRPSLWL